MSSPPVDFPLPLYRNTVFENWSQDIRVGGLWMCKPKNVDDVLACANSLATQKQQWTMRPKAIMHNWSPLTVQEGQSSNNVMLVDTTAYLNQVVSITPASGSTPAQVKVQTGTTMLALMTAMETAGLGFAHIPAPGNITVGGALAINAHGTAIPGSPNDNFNTPYGTLSNLIVAFTAIVTDPSSSTPTKYVAKTFQRGQGDDKAFLTHCGRAFLVDVTLQAIPNYNLQCQSFMDDAHNAALLFAPPASPGGPPPAGSCGDYLNQSGRIEVIWFPPLKGNAGATHPWLKVWSVQPTQPSGSRAVTQPYNYPFSDNIPAWVNDILKLILAGKPELTPEFTFISAAISEAGLASDDAKNLWGASKNTLIYVKDTTLRVTANGYAVLMKKAQVQQAIADFTTEFVNLLTQFAGQNLYPINSPCEIRVTGLDDPSLIVTSSGNPAQSPVISSLSVDPVVVQNGWDVAVWFDVLTTVSPNDSQQSANFYTQMEQWFESHFATGYRYMPEWSKGWAYTNPAGPWTNQQFIAGVKTTLTTGRAADDTWAWEVSTLQKYDAKNLFYNPFLTSLFTT